MNNLAKIELLELQQECSVKVLEDGNKHRRNGKYYTVVAYNVFSPSGICLRIDSWKNKN